MKKEDKTVNKRLEIPYECRFSAYEMTLYILRALAFDDPLRVTDGHTFRTHDYGGSLNDLFILVDDLSTSDGKIHKALDVPRAVWGMNWNRRNPGIDTIELF